MKTSLFIVALAIGMPAYSAAQCELAGLSLSKPERFIPTIGKTQNPEINVDSLKVGPRGWIFGATEENGYMFIIDPVTRARYIWNAGQTSRTVRDDAEGDITDFEVWEEDGQLIVLASHAHPAEIWKYSIEIPESGLPRIAPRHGKVVYTNPNWVRVSSIGRSPGVILAGSVAWGEFVKSYDNGDNWSAPIDFLETTEGVTAEQKTRLPKRHSSVALSYEGGSGRWFLRTFNYGRLEGERYIGRYKHYLNGLAISDDDGLTWRFAKLPRNVKIGTQVREMADREMAAGDLPKALFDLVGEQVSGIHVMDDGSLIATVNQNNSPEVGFGGRVLHSHDGGETWTQAYHIGYRAIAVLPLGGPFVVMGTAHKVREMPPGGAKGRLLLSADYGRTFKGCAVVTQSKIPSKFEDEPYWIVGALSLARSGNTLAIGTVSEGARGQVYLSTLDSQ